ncbi:MAG: glycoside hydrolase family 32 protein [Bacteroidales bacterium]|nr:glycoside hydrolase family 32 protein [Bacteroidales bacterium]
MKLLSKSWIVIAVVFCMAACSNDDDADPSFPPANNEETPSPTEQPSEPEKPIVKDYNEQYRPQIHFTPSHNWMNDPNGLVYDNGVYHLYFQYNPQGNNWGNMSWGHATSSDLIHWDEQRVALSRDKLGDVFSGSAVVDKDNTAGFGEGALIALYTSADGIQQQSLAYSLNGGESFVRYDANPVIKNNDDNLRDPKVFWHKQSGKWIMVLAKGWLRGVEIYGSPDLKTWTHLSTFVKDLSGRPSLQWECPDLIEFDLNGSKKWVLIVSVNPGGPVLGSGTMYFVGDFDGNNFVADELDYPLWLDYGMDNYAGVTYSNTGSRKILIGWMNNWQYAGTVPCDPWRSAFTLPRELSLVEHDGKPLLKNYVVKEIESIAGEWQDVDGNFDAGFAYQMRIKFADLKKCDISLSNADNEKLEMSINPINKTLTVLRTAATGRYDFNGMFSIPSMTAPISVENGELVLDFFVDQSSVEIFSQEGNMSITNLVFPTSIYNQVSVSGTEFTAQVRQLERIW